MMRTIATFALVVAFAAVPVMAQAAGEPPVSFGGDLGLFAPFESGASTSFTLRATADVYWWSPTGMRFALGWANPTLGDEPFDASADITYLTASAIHPFSAGGLQWYGQAGVGLYHLSGDDSGTDLGLTLGAGLEFPLGWEHLLLTPELSAHIVSGDGPRFSLALTVGLHTRAK
ncbi:MAG TPA: outer membrane beta-barrel protein [Thermoanaerobaculaceae bacterium]|nr:outer membrane beta-barrel protein [Thermoanaerobaculaceae bacterium]